jgi:hypothetical protein
MSVASDPRVIALLVLGLVAMKARAHARGTPASESERIASALETASWARVPKQLVRRFVQRAVPLAQCVGTHKGALSDVYSALARVGQGGMVHLSVVITIADAIRKGSKNASSSRAAALHKWASGTHAFFEAQQSLLHLVAGKVPRIPSSRSVEPLLYGIVDHTGAPKVPQRAFFASLPKGTEADDVRGTLDNLYRFIPIYDKAASAEEHALQTDLNLAIVSALHTFCGYYFRGASVDDLAGYFGESPALVLADVLCTPLTHLPTRKAARLIAGARDNGPRGSWTALQKLELSAESKGRIVDTKEPCVETASTLVSRTIEELGKCDSLDAAEPAVFGALCARRRQWRARQRADRERHVARVYERRALQRPARGARRNQGRHELRGRHNGSNVNGAPSHRSEILRCHSGCERKLHARDPCRPATRRNGEGLRPRGIAHIRRP